MNIVARFFKKIRTGISGLLVFCLCIIAGFLLTRLSLFSGPYLPTEAILADKSIIDLHVHTACLPTPENGCYLSPSLRNSYKFPLYLRAFNVSIDELKQHGSQLVVNKLARQVLESQYLSHAVVLAIDAVIDSGGDIDYEKTEFYVPNEFIVNAIEPFPQLLFGASINPMRHDAIERLVAAKAHGAVLIKWLPSIQQFDPADEQFIPFYEKLAELNLPLLSHTGHERAFSQAVNDYADPARLALALKHGVTVIAAHVASTGENEGEDNTQRLYKMMRTHSNLFTEISSLTQLNKLGYLEKTLKQHGYLERVAYGSDMPLINTALVSPLYYPMQLTTETMLNIWRTKNIFDQDIMLKQSLGVPRRVFYLSKKLISHNIAIEDNIVN